MRPAEAGLMVRGAALGLVLAAFAGTASAQYPVMVFGSGYARDCYDAVKDGKRDASKAFQTCDIALNQEQLSRRDRAATHINRGILFMRGKQYDRAMEDYADGLKYEPGMPEAQINLGAAFYYLERFSEAVAALNEGVKVEDIEARAAAHYNRALAFERLGEIERAYADYKMAVSLDPELVQAERQLRRFTVVPASG